MEVNGKTSSSMTALKLYHDDIDWKDYGLKLVKYQICKGIGRVVFFFMTRNKKKTKGLTEGAKESGVYFFCVKKIEDLVNSPGEPLLKE